MKTFIRSNAIYQAENKQLQDDIELSDSVINPSEETVKETVVCECRGEIDDLKKQVAGLTKLVSKPKTEKAKAAPKPKSKKGAVKKK